MIREPGDRVRVYALFNAQTGLVKIGRTTHSVYGRAALIGGQSGCDVTVLGYWRGKRSDEILLHAHFAAVRRKGEWFERTPGLQAWLDSQEGDDFPIRLPLTADCNNVSEAA